MRRADSFSAKGTMLKGMSVSDVEARRSLQCTIIVIGAKGTELGKAVSGIGIGT